LSITFDDGYADNHSVALPILRRLGLHATFFIATGYLDGGCMWNDEIIETVRAYEGDTLDLRALDLGHLPMHSPGARRAAIDLLIGRLKYESPARRSQLAARVRTIANVDLPVNLMMKSAEVRSLCAQGMAVGAHTHSHPILSQLPEREAHEQIAQSKRVLEALTNRPVRLFAYPNGKPGQDYTSVHVRQVRELGFIGACSTLPGCAVAASDAFQLPRFTPWDRESWKFGARLSRNLCNPVAEGVQR
jgi:peptidoglycan/xylan/chitin deacetylase (PgdA/CDA1 family)